MPVAPLDALYAFTFQPDSLSQRLTRQPNWSAPQPYLAAIMSRATAWAPLGLEGAEGAGALLAFGAALADLAAWAASASAAACAAAASWAAVAAAAAAAASWAAACSAA